MAQSLAQFDRVTGPDLIARTTGLDDFISSVEQTGALPYRRVRSSAPGVSTALASHAESRTGALGADGLNLTSQDYLSLNHHPAIREAVRTALDTWGVHSAGSPVLTGQSLQSLALEQALADHLRCGYVALTPTGWSASHSAVTAFVRPTDAIVMDVLAHASLQGAARSATGRITRVPHNDLAAIESAVRRIRSTDTTNGLLIITEGIFSMDSDTPQLKELVALARTWSATLLVDIAHDYGVCGPTGGSMLEAQGVLGEVDIVVGAFSKACASNGGFVGFRDPRAMSWFQLNGSAYAFSNALGPLQIAAAHAAIDIIRSPEGALRRERVLANAAGLRDQLSRRGHPALGIVSPLVMVPVGPDERVGQQALPTLAAAGVWVNYVGHPAVRRTQTRLRLQLMADHTPEALTCAGEAIAQALDTVLPPREQLDPSA